MSHYWLVALVVIVAASIAAGSAWILMRMLLNEEDGNLNDILMTATMTFTVALTLGCIAYNHFAIIGAVPVFVFALFPGYFLVHWSAGWMPESEKASAPSKRKSSKDDDDLGWKVTMGFFSAGIAAALTGGIALRIGLTQAALVAILGAPFVAIWTIGVAVLAMAILVVIFCGGIPRLARALDRQADRIWKLLRKYRAQ